MFEMVGERMPCCLSETEAARSRAVVAVRVHHTICIGNAPDLFPWVLQGIHPMHGAIWPRQLCMALQAC